MKFHMTIQDHSLINHPSTIFLFTTGGPNYNKQIGKERIYYFTIKDDGTLVRDFVPVLDTFDNKYGLYDIVEGKFYGNISSGTFAGGDFIDNSAIITSTDIVSLTYDHALIARWVPETP